MPSLPSLTLPNTWTFIVEMMNVSGDPPKWRTTFDIHQTGSAPLPGDAIVGAIYNFMRANLRTDAHISGSRMRAWSQGPQPFSTRPNIWEESFGVSATTGVKPSIPPLGYGSEAAPPLKTPGDIVLFVKRQTTNRAKPTAMFLRGLLDQDDYDAATGGAPVLLSGSPVQAVNFNSIVAATLSPYINPASDPRLVLVHVGNHHAGPPFSSDVTALHLIGATRNKQGRKNPR